MFFFCSAINDVRSSAGANSVANSLNYTSNHSSDCTDRRSFPEATTCCPPVSAAVPVISATDAYATSEARRAVFENGFDAQHLLPPNRQVNNSSITSNGHMRTANATQVGSELVDDCDGYDDDDDEDEDEDDEGTLLEKNQEAYESSPLVKQQQYHSQSQLRRSSATLNGGSIAQVQQIYAQVMLDSIPADYLRCALAFGHLTLSLMVTSVVMVYAHERVPDRKSHPPLPDLLLENLPFMERGFVLAEWCGLLLFAMWLLIVLFHRHRTVVLRRTFALAGTIFYLRAFTMIITSLSVPSARSECNAQVLVDRSQILVRAWHIFSVCSFSFSISIF